MPQVNGTSVSALRRTRTVRLKPIRAPVSSSNTSHSVPRTSEARRSEIHSRKWPAARRPRLIRTPVSQIAASHGNELRTGDAFVRVDSVGASAVSWTASVGSIERTAGVAIIGPQPGSTGESTGTARTAANAQVQAK
jgi:hypothetical protein